MSFYPISDGLMTNRHCPSNAALIHPVHVQAQGCLAHFLGIANLPWHWRVLSSAHFAHIALAARRIMTNLDLLFASFTMGTSYHLTILPYPHPLPLLRQIVNRSVTAKYSRTSRTSKDVCIVQSLCVPEFKCLESWSLVFFALYS